MTKLEDLGEGWEDDIKVFKFDVAHSNDDIKFEVAVKVVEDDSKSFIANNAEK